uniref:BRF1 domain-containing protein n=1 Tax=Bursaphelenchus xylophilus TaxID=6326 RepID=A0A1I7SNP4_BURXY
DKYGVGDAKAATREEQKMADRFAYCIEQCKNGMTLEEENEEAEVETDNYDSDPDYEDLEEDEPDCLPPEDQVQLSDGGIASLEQAIKAEMQKFPFDCVLNCDQTPIYKEMHSNRTLGLKGEKIVDRYCQSTASA